MDDHDEWLNVLVRRAAQEAVGARQFKGTLVVTGYKPKGHLVKGIIVPHGIESGWVQLAAIHAGNNFGIVVGPKVGDAKKLDGDQLDIEFDLGDPNTITARHRQHSNQDVAPEVESGEMLFMQEGGTLVFYDKDKQLTLKHGPSQNTFVFAKDKSITITHKDSGSNIKIDSEGDQIHDPKDKKHIFKGEATFEKKVTMADDLNVGGATALASGTLGGLGIATV